VLIALACGGLWLISPLHAYEKDTHFGLTYYLARSIGFPVNAALQIAIATWSVDLEPNTQPLRVAPTEENELILQAFHAFSSTQGSIEGDTLPSKVALADNRISDPGLVSTNFQKLWSYGMANGNPGIALHFFEDNWAHAGYSASGFGHLIPNIHAPDYLENNRWTAQDMMTKTVEKLQEFYRAQLGRESCSPEPERLARVLQGLIDANTAQALTPPDYGKAMPVLVAALGDTEKLDMQGLEDDTDSSFRINVEVKNGSATGSIPPRPPGPGGAGRYQGDFAVMVRPIDYLLGERWRDPAVKRDPKDPTVGRVYFVVAGNPDANAVNFNGSHDWSFVEYVPGTQKSPGGDAPGEWHFQFTPTKDDMPKNPPATFISKDPADWMSVKEQVEGKLEWRLALRVGSCKLTGEFYPGEIHAGKNTATGKITADVPAGKAGWGTPTTVEYERAWPEIPAGGTQR